MQNVLCIDLSIDPALVCVVRVEGDSCTVVEHHWGLLGAALASPAPENPLGEGTSVEEAHAPPSSAEGAGTHAVSPLAVGAPFTDAVLVLSPPDYHSLNLDIPIQDPRNLARVIDLEVQDLLPFDLQEFIVEHRVLKSRGRAEQDVHVGIASRSFLAAAIASCERHGVHPLVVTTPASALGTLFSLRPGEFPDNSCIIDVAHGRCHIVCSVGGDVRVDRIIPLPRADLAGSDATDAEALGALLQSESYGYDFASYLQRTLLGIEKRYEVELASIALLSTPENAERLSALLDRPVRTVEPSLVVGGADHHQLRACLAALLVRDEAPYPSLTNFRVKEFSYRPQLKELMQGMRELSGLFVATLSVVLVSVMVLYGIRAYRLRGLRASLHDQLTQAIPEINAPPGDEAQAVQGLITKLNNQLSDLGSPVSSSPLETYQQLSEDLGTQPSIKVRRLSIRGTRVRIEGTSPDYTALESLVEKTLKKRKDVYCRVKTDPGGTTGQSRTFTLDITLCGE